MEEGLRVYGWCFVGRTHPSLRDVSELSSVSTGGWGYDVLVTDSDDCPSSCTTGESAATCISILDACNFRSSANQNRMRMYGDNMQKTECSCRYSLAPLALYFPLSVAPSVQEHMQGELPHVSKIQIQSWKFQLEFLWNKYSGSGHTGHLPSSQVRWSRPWSFCSVVWKLLRCVTHEEHRSIRQIASSCCHAYLGFQHGAEPGLQALLESLKLLDVQALQLLSSHLPAWMGCQMVKLQ